MTRLGISIATVWLASSAVAAAGNGAPRTDRLIVRLYSPGRIPPDALATARATVRTTLGRAAVEVLWRDCPTSPSMSAVPGPCDRTVEPDEVVVRVLAGGLGAGTESVLGSSLLPHDAAHSGFVTIWIDRIEAMAHGSSVDEGQLLGRAIAHELGHVLLGTSKHSARQLMRAVWTARELRDDRRTDWTFSRAEAARLRRSLSARLRQHQGAGADSGL